MCDSSQRSTAVTAAVANPPVAITIDGIAHSVYEADLLSVVEDLKKLFFGKAVIRTCFPPRIRFSLQRREEDASLCGEIALAFADVVLLQATVTVCDPEALGRAYYFSYVIVREHLFGL